MPAPQSAMMKQLARLQFSTNALRVPKDWQQPQGDPPGQQYPTAFARNELAVPPDTVAPPLFLPASTNKYHVDLQKTLNSKFGSFIDGICDAICSAWSTWQSAATLVAVVITGPVAVGGQVVGPPLLPLILAQGPKGSPFELKFTTTIANAINTAWLSYTATIKVAGMPWYPAFAAVPSPVAPPAPNIPCPVIALTQVTVSVSASMLKTQMMGLLGDPNAPYAAELFDAIASAFEKVFQLWQATTMVTNVLGTGPVPTFAPPFVPVGPVLGGVGTMTPGGFV
jgi:hypothetical protein